MPRWKGTTARRAYFGGLILPRKTRYLSRHERGLIALLDNPPRAAAKAKAA